MFFPTRPAAEWLRAYASRIHARALEIRYGNDLRLLFDPDFYRSEYPDVAASGIDPVAHYVLYGAREGRQPHPLFDSQFYLSEYPDVSASGRNPLFHYIRQGWKQERKPNPFFDPRSYRERHGLARERNPLLHYMAELRAGRKPRVIPALSEFLPSPHAGTARASAPVDVIVSLDGGARQAEECIRSVLAAGGETPFDLVVVHDGNLDAAARAHPERDVIVLHGDTAVSGDWIGRLREAAYEAERTGTATPFTNSAGVCGYPRLQGSPFPDDAAGQDAIVREANAGLRVEIPEAPGFCMYVRRECLEAAGGFGAGDFSARVRQAGWKHVLAADVFVARHAAGVVPGRHDDPAYTRRVAAIAHAIRRSGRPVILSITHRLGGGVDEYSSRVRAALGDRAEILTLAPACCGMTVLESTNPDAPFTVWIDAYTGLPELLRGFGTGRVHLQHWKGHRLDVRSLVRDLGVPFDFTIHDYFAACPQVTMTDARGHYCGEPEADGCDACIRERPCGTPDIGTWREANRWVAGSAERVMAPCSDAAARFARYFPAARLVVAPHPEPPAHRPPAMVPVSPDERLRIAVLGSMVPHKGLAKLVECAALARKRRLPLDFRLIGEATGQRSFPFTQTGRYAPHEAGRLLSEFDPHLVWFPGEAPETYSFTLSLCLERGLPVAAPRIGCFPERLAGRRYTWIAPHHWSAEEWIQFFRRMRAGESLAGFAAENSTPGTAGARDFYETRYLEPSRTHPA